MRHLMIWHRIIDTLCLHDWYMLHIVMDKVTNRIQTIVKWKHEPHIIVGHMTMILVEKHDMTHGSQYRYQMDTIHGMRWWYEMESQGGIHVWGLVMMDSLPRVRVSISVPSGIGHYLISPLIEISITILVQDLYYFL